VAVTSKQFVFLECLNIRSSVEYPALELLYFLLNHGLNNILILARKGLINELKGY
jgi:hypothetical protein